MDKVNVLITLRFTDEQLDKLRAVSPRLIVEQRTCHNDEEVTAALDDEVEVLYTAHANFPLDRVPSLKWVQLHWAGVDHVLEAPVMHSAITITTASGIHASNITEYVFASMLAWSHKLPTMLYYQGRSEWPQGRWDIFKGQELRGHTIGIVGYGSIGREVGRLAKAFGMRVVATKREAHQLQDTGYRVAGVGDPNATMLDRVYAPEELPDMLAECDFVVVAVPLLPATRGLIGEVALRAMKPTAYLVNIARGAVVDEAALIRALQEGWIGGAGLDVFETEPLPPDSPLWKLDNVILSPHVAGFTPHYDDRASDLFAENLRRYLAGEPLLNELDKDRGY